MLILLSLSSTKIYKNLSIKKSEQLKKIKMEVFLPGTGLEMASPYLIFQ